jgi:hypothetical protein
MLAAQTNAIANQPAREVVFIAVWFLKNVTVCVNVVARPDSSVKKAKPAFSKAKRTMKHPYCQKKHSGETIF